jgi:hypothetical protein
MRDDRRKNVPILGSVAGDRKHFSPGDRSASHGV